DLARVHVEAAAQDHVLLAVDDPVAAVGVAVADVAAVEPAVAQRLGGGVRPLPVALHHVVAADHDLAALAVAEQAVLVVDDAELDAPHRVADRAGLARL